MMASSKLICSVCGLRVFLESPKKYSLMAISLVCCMNMSSRSTHPPDLSNFTKVMGLPELVVYAENRRSISLCNLSEPRIRIVSTVNS